MNKKRKVIRPKRVTQRIKSGLILAFAFLMALSMSACSTEITNDDSSNSSSTSSSSSDSSGEVVVVEASNDTAIQSDASVMDSYDWSFSSRDLDASYDETEATYVTLSDAGIAVEGNGASADGSALTISEDGVYILRGTLSDGSIVVDLPGDEDKAQIVLDNANITNSDGPGILVESADKVFITLAEGSQNYVADGSTREIGADENDHDGAIFSHDDLTLNGSGALTVVGNYDNGIVGKDDVRITGGTYIIDTLGHGIQGKDCIKILDGNFTVTSGADAFHASNDEDEMLGYLGIGGGTYTVNAGDDAFHAESALLIADGSVDIVSAYEGYEGRTVSITGATTTMITSDDGVNAASGSESADDQGFMRPETGGGGGRSGSSNQAADVQTDSGVTATVQTAVSATDCFIEITGGILTVKAGGDGLDSNGTLAISGGEIIIESVATGGNGAIDAEYGATISGGILMAIGSSNMAQGFSDGSTQASILTNVTGISAGSSLSILDASGNEIYSFTPTSSNSSLVASTPDMTEGETYTVESGGQSIINVTAALATGGGMGMGGGEGRMF